MALCLLAAIALVRRALAHAARRAAPRRAGRSRRRRLGLRASLRMVLDSPHLRAISAIVVLSSFVTAVASWQFRAIAQQALVTKDAMAAFFGTFNGWVGVLCVATQLLFTASVLRRLGLGPVLFLLPLVLLSGSAWLLGFATLAAAVLLKGADKVMRYSIDRPAMELLYLPLPPAAQAVRRSRSSTPSPGARATGSPGSSVLALATVGGLAPKYLSLVTLPAIGLWLLLASRAHHRYVATLEESLQQHRLDAERAGSTLLDRETTEVLASRLGAVDPEGDPVRARAAGRRPPGDRRAPRGARPARPRRRRGAPPRALAAERGRRPLDPAARGGPAPRPRPRGANRGAALPLAPRPRRPAVARQGLRRLPRLLGALRGGRGARAARRRPARGGRAAVRGDGGGGRRAGATDAARGGAARRAGAAAVRGVAAAAGAGRRPGGGAHRDPRRGARRRRAPSSTC